MYTQHKIFSYKLHNFPSVPSQFVPVDFRSTTDCSENSVAPGVPGGICAKVACPRQSNLTNCSNATYSSPSPRWSSRPLTSRETACSSQPWTILHFPQIPNNDGPMLGGHSQLNEPAYPTLSNPLIKQTVGMKGSLTDLSIINMVLAGLALHFLLSLVKLLDSLIQALPYS